MEHAAKGEVLMAGSKRVGSMSGVVEVRVYLKTAKGTVPTSPLDLASSSGSNCQQPSTLQLRPLQRAIGGKLAIDFIRWEQERVVAPRRWTLT
jgi:hypothetical protein